MSTLIDVINITAKTKKIHSGALKAVTLPAFYDDPGTIQHTDVITLTGLELAATSSGANTGFKLTYNAVETIAFAVNSNATAAAIQAALRTATGDTGLVVTPASANDNTGPFTVTYSDGFVPLTAITVTHGSWKTAATLTGYSGTDTFKITYNAAEGATVFTRGTNYTAAAIQAALRTATGDTGLIVQTGTITDAGFTVVYSAGFTPASELTITSGSGVTGVFSAKTEVAGTVTDVRASVPRVISVDLDALSSGGRRDLQLLLSSGSIVVGKTGTLNPKAVVVTNIALGTRARIGGASGLKAVKLPARTAVTVDLTALGHNGRRDLINLYAAGVIAYGTAATNSVVNVSSKRVRIGVVGIDPKRVAGTYQAHTFNLTTASVAQRRDLQHYLAAGQVLTHAA